MQVHSQARGSTIRSPPPPASSNSPSSSASPACFAQATSQAALPHHCTVSAYSSPALLHSCTTPARNICHITCSHALMDMVHPGRTEEAHSGVSHIQLEKRTAWTGSNSVNLGSVGSVFLPTHTTLGNSWLDLYTSTPSWVILARGDC